MKVQPSSKIYKPQAGPQYQFLASKADLCLFGGGAGGGKTYALLLESLRFHNKPGFTCAFFRKNAVQLRSPGGLWSNTQEIFRDFKGIPKETTLEWNFPNGGHYKLAHLDLERDVYGWQGSQIALIIFDELTHFSKAQFFYMLSRNRSTCGIKPYVRMTCNPDAGSWVRELVDWWINPETGLAIPQRSGVIRWFIMLNDVLIWDSCKTALQEKYPGCLPKSFTFISASIYDNKKLLDADPGYLANLQALSRVERERLLMGNWNIKPSAGNYFKKHYFEIVDAIPATLQKVRYWDRAATKKTDSNDPDSTVGIKLEKDSNNIIYITDMIRIQESPLGVQSAIKNTAIQDGKTVRIGLEEDPGQAGIADIENLVRLLQGFIVKRNRVTKDKVTRALPASAQAEAGTIKIVRASWNEVFFNEVENFPEGNHDDIVDAFSGAFNMINDQSYSLGAFKR